jgi:hypothetical protein
MTERKELRTVAVFNAWMRTTAVDRAREEARVRVMVVDRVLADVERLVRSGDTLQDACDGVWSRRGKYASPDMRQFIEDTLKSIGWARRGKKLQRAEGG